MFFQKKKREKTTSFEAQRHKLHDNWLWLSKDKQEQFHQLFDRFTATSSESIKFCRNVARVLAEWPRSWSSTNQLARDLEVSPNERTTIVENPLWGAFQIGGWVSSFIEQECSRLRLALCHGTMILRGGHSHNWRPSFGRKQTCGGNEAVSSPRRSRIRLLVPSKVSDASTKHHRSSSIDSSKQRGMFIRRWFSTWARRKCP